MTRPRRIAVITGARSDYGLMSGVLAGIRQRKDLELLLVVTGMHLSPEFGETVEVIESKFPIAARVETLLSSNSGVGTAKSIGLGVIGFADALQRLAPDIVLLFGDRFETFAAAQAAMALTIPIAHVHGGEVTEGAIDEHMRHCISKMAHLHLVSADPHRERLLRMGERPETVHVVGAPGLDHFAGRAFPTRDELAGRLGHPLPPPVFLVTYHPATLGDIDPVEAFDELVAALDRFKPSTVIMTLPNADSGGRGLVARARQYAQSRPEDVILAASLGQELYIGALAVSDVVIGNSSSGLIEAPAAGTPTVNLGDRQKGRLRGDTVIDCAERRDAIEQAIRAAMMPAMRERAARRRSPYGEPGQISGRIVELLAGFEPGLLRRKAFFDSSPTA